MSNADVESDPMFPLLTDALRAGPGSPEWHQAVAKLRADGLADSDEYRLLVVAREHLASGREYKSVRAGPGFTRKVLEGVEAERQKAAGGRKPAGLPIATILATVSILAVIGVLAYVGYQIFGKSTPVPPPTDDLATAYFPTVAATATFENGAAVPAEWRRVGSLALEPGKAGLRPASDGAGGGAIVSPVSVGPDEPFAVEVKLKPGQPTDDLIVQVFVSSEDDFSGDKSTSSRELTWLRQAGRQKVTLVGDADSRVLAEAGSPEVAGGGAITIRVNVNRDSAVVFDGGRVLWSGPNGLTAKPRTVGVRFLRVDADKPLVGAPEVQSIRVLKK